jgi:hypothetical protein
VVVLSPATGTTFTVVKSIFGIFNPFGIDCDQSTGIIYVASGNASTIILTVIDSLTNTIVRVAEGIRQSTTATVNYSLSLDLVNGYAYVTDAGATGANFATTTRFKIK